MKPAFAAALVALLIRSAFAQEVLDPDQAFRFSARALDPSTVEVTYLIAPGYYLYRDNFNVQLDGPSGAKLGEPRFPPGEMKKDPIFGEVEIYRDEVKIKLPVALPPGAKEVTLVAGSRGCTDTGICFLPEVRRLRISMTDFRENPPTSAWDRLNPPSQSSSPDLRPDADLWKALQRGGKRQDQR